MEGNGLGCFWPALWKQRCWQGTASLSQLSWPAGGQLLLSFSVFALHLPVITFSLLTCKVSHFPPAACVHLRTTVNPNRGSNTFDKHHCCHQLFNGVFSSIWMWGSLPVMALEDSGAELPAGSAGDAHLLPQRDDVLPLPLLLPHLTLNWMKPEKWWKMSQEGKDHCSGQFPLACCATSSYILPLALSAAVFGASLTVSKQTHRDIQLKPINIPLQWDSPWNPNQRAALTQTRNKLQQVPEVPKEPWHWTSDTKYQTPNIRPLQQCRTYCYDHLMKLCKPELMFGTHLGRRHLLTDVTS